MGWGSVSQGVVTGKLPRNLIEAFFQGDVGEAWEQVIDVSRLGGSDVLLPDTNKILWANVL